jgi:hypothetical protein
VLNKLSMKTRQSALDALVIANDVYTWKLLRRDMGRSKAETKTTMTDMIHSTLGGP